MSEKRPVNKLNTLNLKVRISEDGQWGFVEKYRNYSYPSHEYVEAVVGVSADGTFVKPYILKDDKFYPAKVIEDEMGIKKYLNAKKPFYSLFSDGFVVKIRAGLSITKDGCTYVPERSYFTAYTPVRNSISGEPEMVGDYLVMMKIKEVTDILSSKMEVLMRQLGESSWDREKFLKGRM